MLNVVRSKVAVLSKIASLRLRVRRGWPVMMEEGKDLLSFLFGFFPTVAGGKARAPGANEPGFEFQLCHYVSTQQGGRTTTVT